MKLGDRQAHEAMAAKYGALPYGRGTDIWPLRWELNGWTIWFSFYTREERWRVASVVEGRYVAANPRDHASFETALQWARDNTPPGVTA